MLGQGSKPWDKDLKILTCTYIHKQEKQSQKLYPRYNSKPRSREKVKKEIITKEISITLLIQSLLGISFLT